MKKILLVRTDRIGDVILSLPAAALIKKNMPGSQVYFLTREYTAPLAAMSSQADGVMVGNGENIFRLVRLLCHQNFDAAILLHPTFKLALTMWLAGIPLRVGTAYRAYSLLFNQRVALHRRHSPKHELELNLDLVRRGLGLDLSEDEFSLYRPQLSLDINRQQGLRSKLGWVQGKTIIIHPGSGGSARDWPLEYFAQLASSLVAIGYRVAITLGPGEEELRHRMEGSLPAGIQWLQGLGLETLATAISLASLLVANSTGPLHIATAVGTKSLGIYCPIKPCLPQRWGPYGPGHRTILPDVPHCEKCIGSQCNFWDCMRSITVERVLAHVKEMVA